MPNSNLFQNVIEGIFSTAFLAATLRVTTPILLASLGALISDRAGVINIGLEGIMLAAAFTGVVFSAKAQAWLYSDIPDSWLPWVGLAFGVFVSILMALLLAFFHLRLKADLILSGVALNILGAGATVAVMVELTGDRGTTLEKLASARMPFIQLDHYLPNFLFDVPVLSFFLKIFDNQSVMTWIAFISIGVVWYFMYRMPTGIHLRAVGENPEAAASVGIRVQRVRYLALVLSGVLAGLGGIHLSMGYLNFFQRDMSTGRGFIALATPYLGGGHPVGTGLASLIFGAFEALSIRLGSLEIPSQLPFMMPHIATVMALVIYALQSQLTARVRTLRSARGEDFDARYWQSIQRLSVLHMFMAMLAVIGIIISASMFAAPDGFEGTETAYPVGNLVALMSSVLILMNIAFMIQVERIGRRVLFSLVTALLSLWLYLGLFFVLFMSTISSDDLRLSFSSPGDSTTLLTLGVLFALLGSVTAWLLARTGWADRLKFRVPAIFVGVWTAFWGLLILLYPGSLPPLYLLVVGDLAGIIFALSMVVKTEYLKHRHTLAITLAVWFVLYLALFLVFYALYEELDASAHFPSLLGLLFGWLAGMALWLSMGGWYLMKNAHDSGLGYWGDLKLVVRPTGNPHPVIRRPAFVTVYAMLVSLWTAWLIAVVILLAFGATTLWMEASPILILLILYGASMAWGLWSMERWGWTLAFVLNGTLLLSGLLFIPILATQEDMSVLLLAVVLNSVVTFSIFGMIAWWLWNSREQFANPSPEPGA